MFTSAVNINGQQEQQMQGKGREQVVMQVGNLPHLTTLSSTIASFNGDQHLNMRSELLSNQVTIIYTEHLQHQTLT